MTSRLFFVFFVVKTVRAVFLVSRVVVPAVKPVGGRKDEGLPCIQLVRLRTVFHSVFTGGYVMSGINVGRRIGIGAICLLAISWGAVASAGTISTGGPEPPAGGPVGPPVRLDQLLGPGGGSIQVDDKLFDDFSYSWSGDMPSPDRVNVAPFVDDHGNPGLEITGPFQDLPSPGGSDAVISYSVWVTHPDPHVKISDVHLYGQLNVAGGPGNVLITESYLNTSPEFLSIFYENPPGAGQLTDWTFLATPVRHLRVKKDILANATGQSGIAAVTIIEQSFSQVPEPCSALLALVMGVCLCGRRRGRRA